MEGIFRKKCRWQLGLGIGLLSGGRSCRTEPSTCGIWCCLQQHCVRTEFNCRTPSWCSRTPWWWWWLGEHPRGHPPIRTRCRIIPRNISIQLHIKKNNHQNALGTRGEAGLAFTTAPLALWPSHVGERCSPFLLSVWVEFGQKCFQFVCFGDLLSCLNKH